ncbi:hypothetical protein AMAG_07120 [Allomyces macrogynus ATCC 38327]|uniref:Mediator of RNA polymerase II transcription subunit 8 n=1 Tax=Allomyces macrogynus (strain ATCC 38327) TaxID=578462 RepID=A0A0L0SHB9_ALLM3|nr:hypothetical protein AMAG_07120 [Allomyces macrogynus ATCC 38327]|eukprot:KNE61844.1 hypothetical protein AMAG_07120 [Allomyces macrogynus ATCC 38327]
MAAPPPPTGPSGGNLAPFTNAAPAPPRPPTTDAHAHLDAVARHLDGLLAAAHDLRHHAPHLPYPALLTRLQVVTARMAALAHAMPAAALKDFLVLPFATPATRPHAAHAPEWLRSRPGPPLADREREMVEREKERVKRVAEAAASAGTGRTAGGGEELLGGPPAKRARRGLAAALATAAATTSDAPAVPVQPVAPRAAADDPVVAMQARLDLEIKHHDRLVNVTVDYIRGTESDSDGEGGADADAENDDEDEGAAKGRATGLVSRARRGRNEPGEYLRRVRALYMDLPPTPTPTAGHDSDAASDDGAVVARRRRGSARRRAVRTEMPPVELARRLDDVVRYMHVGPGPAVVAPPPMAMDPRRGGGTGGGGGRVGYVMSPDGGAVIAPRRTAGEK